MVLICFIGMPIYTLNRWRMKETIIRQTNIHTLIFNTYNNQKVFVQIQPIFNTFF